LIVDDDEENILTYSTYVSSVGMIPLTSISAKTAMVFIKAKIPFDIALIDIRMPNIDGIKLSNMIRSNGGDFPLIAMSSAGSIVSSNFEQVLEKPVRRSKLLRVISKVLNKNSNTRVSIDVLTVRTPSTENKSPILVAEDDASNRKVIEAWLKKFKYTNVTMVENGLLAIETLKERNFKLAFIDIKMPIVDGIEVAKYVNTHIDKEKRPVLVALTAVGSNSEKNYYTKLCGMDYYILKPINSIKLKELLNKVLGPT
jgi:CheY-like chemotaxis protein